MKRGSKIESGSPATAGIPSRCPNAGWNRERACGRLFLAFTV